MPDWLTAQLVWFVVGMLLLIAEFGIPGLVIGFFGVGALLTALVVKLGWIRDAGQEILLCAVLSVALLAALRRFVARWFQGFTADARDLARPPHDVAGTRVEVVEAIDPDGVGGHVRLNGVLWKAQAKTGIAAGTVVEVIGVEGLVVHVRPPDPEDSPGEAAPES